ncbi:MAG: amidohydrolase family protein [Chloroflexi bacterium]|nr:amidohydrolase family protein [Chloroflexota bacterium]
MRDRSAPGPIALINGQIVLPDRIVHGQALVIEDGKIAGLAWPGDLGGEIAQVDVAGRIIAPGLVDIHTHGAVHHSFNEPDAMAYEAITVENARRGVTSLLATLAAVAPISELCTCLDFCRSWMAPGGQHNGAQVLGAHLESPFIDPAQAGGVNRKGLRAPADGSAEPLLVYGDVLRIFVLAPELPGALDLVTALVRNGIMPAAGHSSCRDTDVAAAMERGLRHITHIWSAQSSTIRVGPWRKPGLLEASLVFDGLMVEMISDNRHLPPTLMKLAYKCIGPDRLCAISDATSGAGLPEGSPFTIGGMAYEVRAGVGMLIGDNTTFAGSSTLLNQMVPILTDAVGIPLVEAVRMASLTPAKAIGWADRKGSLEPGKDADVAIFNPDFTAWRTMIGGRWVVTD